EGQKTSRRAGDVYGVNTDEKASSNFLTVWAQTYGVAFEAAVGCSARFGGRVRDKPQTCSPPTRGMARINCATCSGSSSWTKCWAPGIRKSSDPGKHSWNVRATPLFRERSASPKMIRTGRRNSFIFGTMWLRERTMGNKSTFRRKKAG